MTSSVPIGTPLRTLTGWLTAGALAVAITATAVTAHAQPDHRRTVAEPADPWPDPTDPDEVAGKPDEGDGSGEGADDDSAYQVRQPDPWEPPRRRAAPPRDDRWYDHRDAWEPWPATRGERRRQRGSERPVGRRSPRRRAVEEEPTAGYAEGFFLGSEDGRFRLQINGRFEARYSYQDRETADGATVSSAFSIPRSRLVLSGHLFGPELTYRIQPAIDGGMPQLKDVYADYRLVPGYLHVRAGQYKRPLTRQQINSSVTFQFLERAITSGRLGAARDIGVLLHDDYEQCPPFEYAVGLFNGTGSTPRLVGDVVVDPIRGRGPIVDGAFTNVPDRFHPELTARVAYNHGDIDGYSEVDFEGGPARFSVGSSVLVGLSGADDNAAAFRDGGSILAHLDTMLKVHGLTTTAAGFLLYLQEGDRFADQAYAATGFHLQAGYLFFDRAQPAVRYARVHRQGEGTLHEMGGALSIYFLGTHLAWRTDALVYLEEVAPERRNHFLLRSQLQLLF